ncbi:MAG: hypothetical protein ACYDAE_11980 [Steroidobacteraceae bacterium]
MQANAGVWIDHRKAVIVVVTPTGEYTALVVSKVEKHPQRSGDSPMKGRYESRQVPADDSRQRALTGALNIYYDAVIAAFRAAESVLIVGPGEAKGELRRRLGKAKVGVRVAAVESADKMTDRQIAARVHEYFSVAWSPRGPKHGRPNAGLVAERPRRAVR